MNTVSEETLELPPPPPSQKRRRAFSFTMRKITFKVTGVPVPKGSVFGRIRGYPNKNWNKAAFEKGIKSIIARIYNGEHPVIDVMPVNKNLKKWEATVKDEARAAMAANTAPFSGPCRVMIVFYIKRPGKHFGKRNKVPYLKDKYASAYCTKTPDVDKLTRSVFDAMNGVVFKDDAQVVDVASRKLWGKSPGIMVTVEELQEQTVKSLPDQKQMLLNFGG